MRDAPDVFRVRRVTGVIASEAGPWPDEVAVVFQLYGPAPHPVLRKAAVVSDGTFRVPDAPPGNYCFEASAVGWDPVVGRINVSRANPKSVTVSFTLPLGT